MPDAAMRQNDAQIWGQDIALGDNGQAKVASNGELILTEGVETGVQDIGLRLFIRLGTLFYDLDFGSLISDWFLDESTPHSRQAFLSEVTTRVEADPRVELGSVKTKLLKWDETGFQVQTSWRFIGEDHPMNLVLSYDKSVAELVIGDVRHDAPAAWAPAHRE